MYWGGGAAVSVTLTTPHVLIGTQEIVLDWDKKTGVLVPCRRGAEVSRGQQRSAGVSRRARRRTFAALLEAVGKCEALKAAAKGRTLEVVPHCRLLEDADFPGP